MWKRVAVVLLWLAVVQEVLSDDFLQMTEREEEMPRSGGPPDRVEVVSSALRVLPRRRVGGRSRRSAASSTGWRKPRDYEFVTREGGRSPRRLPYPDEENFPPQDYFERRRDYPNRRIIYYASLPDVVRRPGEWTPPRPIYYPPPSQNEIVTRVHSGVIDVSNPNNAAYNPKYPDSYNPKYPDSYNPKYPDSYNPKYPDSYSTKYPESYNKYPDRFGGGEELPPRFTIIDAEPPYNRPSYHPPPPHHQGLRDYDRYDYRRQDYNRYDYRDPYRPSYYEPYRHQQLPAQPVTVVRRPLDIGRPLDVRPLVPLHPLSTQAPPVQGSSSSPTTEATTTTSSSSASQQDLTSFERAFKSSS